MKTIVLLFIININIYSQSVQPSVIPAPMEEKFFYTGENSIVTGWTGPWPIDQQASINAICEVIFEGQSGIPVKIEHLKLNPDGTLLCPPEKDAANVAAQDIVEADREAIRLSMKAIDCGKRVKARMLVINAKKSLNNGQKRTIISTYSGIQSALEAGSLDVAKEDIDGTPTTALVTAQDKIDLMAELDKCK